MSYLFKPGPELVWSVVVTVVGVIAAAVATQGALPPTDVKTWGLALAAGVARAILGLILSAMGPNDAG